MLVCDSGLCRSLPGVCAVGASAWFPTWQSCQEQGWPPQLVTAPWPSAYYMQKGLWAGKRKMLSSHLRLMGTCSWEHQWQVQLAADWCPLPSIQQMQLLNLHLLCGAFRIRRASGFEISFTWMCKAQFIDFTYLCVVLLNRVFNSQKLRASTSVPGFSCCWSWWSTFKTCCHRNCHPHTGHLYVPEDVALR